MTDELKHERMIAKATAALEADYDHLKEPTTYQLAWLAAQLSNYPTRVCEESTTNLRFITMSAARFILASLTNTPVTEGDELGLNVVADAIAPWFSAADIALGEHKHAAIKAVEALATRTVTEGDLREAAELAACYFEEGGKLGRSVPTIILKQLRAALATRPASSGGDD